MSWNKTVDREKVEETKDKLDYQKADFDSIRAALAEISWQEIFDETKSVEEMWTTLKSILSDLVTRYVPKRRQWKKRKTPWIAQATIKRMKDRGKAWFRYKNLATEKSYNEYKRIRNEVNTLVRNDHDSYQISLINNFKGNKKRFYGYMRRLQTNPSGIAQLRNEKGEPTRSDQEIADTLGRYFQEVYTREDLSNNIQDLSTSIVPPPEQFSDLDICLDEGSVEKALARLQSDKSPGPDGVHPMLLKECAKFLANPLSKIFKKSLDSGTIPQDWKQADIAPIFKKGNRTDAANYRPVSLTSVVCKVMESLIKQQLVRHLESNNMISKHQHGFRKGRSCLTNLLETFEEWTTALDEGHGIDVVYLDYRKAFDTVPHKRLVEKLKLFGIAGATLKWIEDFLQGRTTRVIVRNNSSKWLKVLSGVPQGSVLGPLLFLIFINDLPDWISCSVKLFADDTKVWKIIDSVDDQKVLQKDLDNMMAWSRIWLLWFNPEKCKIMHIGHSLNTVYHLGETERQILIVSKEEKDLGITVTNDLKSAVQCSKAAAKARSIAGLIRRNFRRLEKPEFLALYKAYIRPHMEFIKHTSDHTWSSVFKHGHLI